MVDWIWDRVCRRPFLVPHVWFIVLGEPVVDLAVSRSEGDKVLLLAHELLEVGPLDSAQLSLLRVDRSVSLLRDGEEHVPLLRSNLPPGGLHQDEVALDPDPIGPFLVRP